MKIKNIFSPKAYRRFIKARIQRFLYSISDNEIPNHDFIILNSKTKKWKINGFKQVGEDWHIQVIRLSDFKTFLLDQPFFYCLQIYKNKNININKELFITYGTNPRQIKKMIYMLKKMKL